MVSDVIKRNKKAKGNKKSKKPAPPVFLKREEPLDFSYVIKKWDKKKKHLEQISSSIRSLRYNLTKDLKGDDEKQKITALIISIMDKTAERVGNDDSAESGHFGVTCFQKPHITIIGNAIHLKYKGKSGVDHEKSFSDPLIAKQLKQVIKNSPSKFVFVTKDGFRVRADKVNRYLKEYGISAKDIRGFCANSYMIARLKKQDVHEEEKKRKAEFNKAVKHTAIRVGHGAGTLKSHYLMPELNREYIKNGKILDLSDFYKEGGEVKKLLAPNGKPTNLSPEIWHLVRTPDFIKWFGNWETNPEKASKVVDENGEPLVVYHGTDSSFTIFKPSKSKGNFGEEDQFLGIYFTDTREVAKWFTHSSVVKTCFLNIRNPLYAHDNKEALEITKSENKDKATKKAKRMGYDGILLKKGFFAQGEQKLYLAFYPEQIKLADGDNTTFDGTNPNIRMKKGGDVKELIAPNGKVSNLSPEQYKLVRTTEFKKWFGDWEKLQSAIKNDPSIDEVTLALLSKDVSKAIDKNGEPLVVYHGSYSKFNKFDRGKLSPIYHEEANEMRDTGGFYFTDDINIAIGYKNRRPNKYNNRWEWIKSLLKEHHVREFFLNIKNPNLVYGEGKSWNCILETKDWCYSTDEISWQTFQDNKNDGVIFKDIIDTADSGHYKQNSNIFVAFHSQQIKLADGTNKTFDSSNPDIRMQEGGETNNLDNPEKSTNFIERSKDELKNIISGTCKVTNGTAIQTASDYLRRSQSSSTEDRGSNKYKKQEEKYLKSFISANNLWVSGKELKNFIGEGSEQKVYLIDSKNVVKTNDAIFYTSWQDYFNSLLLHNYFFPATAYELIGFIQNDNTLYAVVKQPFVQETQKTDLGFVKKFLSEKGFINKKNEDYYNPELGLILEDLHEGNVLTNDGVLFFIDTVFYISPEAKSKSAKEYFEKGGELPIGLQVINHFYSPIEKRILQFKQPKASATKWKEIVGIKSDEAVYSGVSNLLNKMKPDAQLEKKELLDFMKRNRIRLHEIIKGGEDQYFNYEQIPQEVKDLIGGEIENIQDISESTRLKMESLGYEIEYDMDGEINGIHKRNAIPTKYEKYQLSGDKITYLEVLITLPNRTIKGDREKVENIVGNDKEYLEYVKKREEAQIKGQNYDLPAEEQSSARNQYYHWATKASERATQLAEVYQEGTTKYGEFESGHWEEENIIVHMRFSIRNDVHGNKIIFIQELQSDWGQQGKRLGFRNDEQDYLKNISKIEEKQNELSASSELYSEYEKIAQKKYYTNYYNLTPSEKTEVEFDLYNDDFELYTQLIKKQKELDDELEKLQNEIRHNIDLHYELNTKIPVAPYVTDTNAWVKLGLKYIILYAVQNNIKKIAWATGEQENDLYDLSKQVDELTYSKHKDDGDYQLAGYKNDIQLFNYWPIKPEKLQDYVGKEVSEKMINGEGEKIESGNKEEGTYELLGMKLSGVDLKVGGKGMVGFYGSTKEKKAGIIGNVAKALVKELSGNKVELEEIQLRSNEHIVYLVGSASLLKKHDNNIQKAILDAEDIIDMSIDVDVDNYNYYKSVKYELENAKHQEVITDQYAFEITPELKESVELGIPQFKEGGITEDSIKTKLKKLNTLLENNRPNNIRGYINKISEMLYNGHDFKSKVTHEKLAEKYNIKKKDEAKEYAELEIIETARKIIEDNKANGTKATYDALTEMYERQPSLTHRTSYTVIHQQYSTPAPIAYIMGVWCGINEDNGQSKNEPIVFFHGTTHENLESIQKNGFDIDNADFYASTNIYDAIGFGCDKGNKISSLLTIKPKPTAKIFDITNPFEGIKSGFVKKEGNSDYIRFKVNQADMDDYVRANGYDAYMYPESLSGGGTEVDYATKQKWIQIINPKAFEYEYLFDMFTCFDFKKNNEDKTYADRHKKIIDKELAKNNIPEFHDFPERNQADEKYSVFSQELEDSGFDHKSITEEKYGFESVFYAMYQILRKPIYDNLEKYYPKEKENKNDGNRLFFEPTAGTGLLTIAGKPENFIVNEIDKLRLEILRMQPFKEILSQDATAPFTQFNKHKTRFDAIITNPPFGTTKHTTVFGTYHISGLEQLVVCRALDYLSPEGKASIIIGGHTEYDSKGRLKNKKDVAFLNYLAHYFDIQDVINVSGEVYRKQGASYPVRIILINKRKSEPKGYYPLADFNLSKLTPFSPLTVNNLTELYDRISL